MTASLSSASVTFLRCFPAVIFSSAARVETGIRATTESAVVRWLLIGVAALFLGLFLFMPLAVVFATALQKGVATYFASFNDPDALAAIRLTLLAAGIAGLRVGRDI